MMKISIKSEPFFELNSDEKIKYLKERHHFKCKKPIYVAHTRFKMQSLFSSPPGRRAGGSLSLARSAEMTGEISNIALVKHIRKRIGSKTA